MLRVTVELVPGGFEQHRQTLGQVLIVNTTGAGQARRADYDVRAYRRSTARGNAPVTAEDWRDLTPFREGRVLDHARVSRPVWDLVARALLELGYSSGGTRAEGETG